MDQILSTEQLIETKVCRQCQASFLITDKDLEFYDKVSPVFAGKKYQIPSPTLCPDCRQQRRLTFRNERKLYRRTCDATGKSIISVYSPDKPYKVYHQDFWWSDGWNPLDYGQAVDSLRSFLDQLSHLSARVPKSSLSLQNCENSDYNNQSGKLKDCYLLVNSNRSEMCFFGKGIYDSSDVVDCMKAYRCQHCYECLNCYDCMNLAYSRNCFECRDSRFLVDCVDCVDCFGCTNLRHAKYAIFNTKYTKDEYEKKMLEISGMNQNLLTALLSQQTSKLARLNLNIENSERSSGDYLTECNNVAFAFDVKKSESIKYCSDLVNSQDVYDVDYFGFGLDWSYDSVTVGVHSSRILFCADVSDNCADVFYSQECFSCKNCFGCIGLRNKQYCILNKQYTKEQYEELVPKIIEKMIADSEWGEFFPASMSPFGYNETVANEYFPLDPSFPVLPPKGEGSFRQAPLLPGEGSGVRYNWSDYEAPFPKVEKIIPASKLPDDITKIPDDILNWAIECEVSNKPFRIIKQEFEFYRKHNLPIPKRHPDQRHKDRMALRNPRKLFERKCDKCQKDILTTYAPERTEIVYCEECYNREVV